MTGKGVRSAFGVLRSASWRHGPAWGGVLALVVAFGVANPVAAQETTLTFDFSSTALRDAGSTTADWDTVSSTLHLPAFTPNQIGTAAATKLYQGLDICGNYAYLAAGSSGLSVVNFEDPTNPALVYDEGGAHFVQDVAVYGELLFAAGGSQGLHLYTLTDPANPVYVATASYTDTRAVCADGSLILVADGVNGLRILYTVGAAIQLVGTLNTAGLAMDVDAAGGIAVVADNSALRVIDITNPVAPTEISNWPGTAVESVDLDWPLAYVGTGTGMQILDISDPAAPVLLGTYPTPGIRSVSVDWDYGVVTTLGGIEIVDLRDPAAPALHYTQATGDESGFALMKEGRVFWADGSDFRIVQSALKTNIYNYRYQPGLGDDWLGLAAEGKYLYAFRNDGLDHEVLSVYDATDAMNPSLVGQVQTSPTYFNSPADLAVRGGYAYLADRDQGIRVFDVRDPTAPVQVNQFLVSPLLKRDVEVQGTFLVTTSRDSLQVFDLYDPANPVPLWSIATSIYLADNTAVNGSLLYYVDDGTLYVVNLLNNTPLGSTYVGGSARTLVLDGDYLYVNLTDNSIATVDVSDTYNPALVGNYSATSFVARDMMVVGDNLLILDTSSLAVLDISTPTAPYQIWRTFLPALLPYDDASHMVRTGDFVHLGRPSGGHFVIPIQSERVDYTQNQAVSIDLSPFNTNAMDVRVLPAARTDSVSFGLDDNGEWFGPYPLGGGVVDIRLFPASSLVDPMVDEVTYEWAYQEPTITSITDVPNDQGKQARIEWMKSSDDFTGYAIPGDLVTEYSVYRRIEAGYAPGLMRTASPPGEWEYVTSVPADGLVDEGHYAAVVPTVADSTIADGMHWTTYYVRARTVVPGTVWDSPPDSGYSVDNLAPSIPSGLLASPTGGGTVNLAWDANPEEDVRYYNVYRGSTDGFVPDAFSRIGTTAGPAFTDPSPGGEDHYKVTAVDFSGNESDPASATLAATGTRLPDVTHRFHLYPAAPNPFRAGSRIVYEVPDGGSDVSLVVYDVQGRSVRTLLSGWQPTGVADVRWDGRDDSGRNVPGGVYFLKLVAPGFRAKTRLVRIH